MRPILVLDVDEVLNPVTRDNPGTWPDFESYRLQLYRLWLSKAMAQAILGLGCELQWLTTWNEDDAANKEVGPLLGLETLPVVGVPPDGYGFRNMLWKHKHMERLIAANPGRDIVWVDDDCLGICRMAPGPLTDDSDSLYLVAPEVGVGLTPGHILEIRQWLQSRGHKGTP